MVYETKLTSGNAFTLDLFAVGKEKESKYDERTLVWAPCRNLTCLLTLSLRNKPILIFSDYFSLKHLLTPSS